MRHHPNCSKNAGRFIQNRLWMSLEELLSPSLQTLSMSGLRNTQPKLVSVLPLLKKSEKFSRVFLRF